MVESKIGRNEPCPCGSGKKYKKCCLPTLSRRQVITMLDTASSRIADRVKTAWPVARSRGDEVVHSAFQNIPANLVLEGAEGAKTIVDAMSLLEQELAAIAHRHSQNFWTMALRRLPKPAVGKHRLTPFNIQWIAELACIKYGIRQSQENEFEEAESTSAVGPWGENKKLVPRIDSQGVIDLLTLYRIATEYYFLTAAFRRIGKGWRYILKGGELNDFEPSSDLEFLIDLYDRRQSGLESGFATLGIFIPDEQLDEIPKGRMFPYCLVAGAPREGEGRPLRIGSYEIKFTPPHEARFAPGTVTLEGFIPYLRLIEEDFEERFGISPYVVLSCVGVLSGQMGGIIHKDPFAIIQLITRGGFLVSEEIMREILTHGLGDFHKSVFNSILSSSEIARCIDIFLKLAVIDPDEVDLQAMNPKKFCWGDPGRLFVNSAGILQFLITLALGIPTRDEAKQLKGDMFEADIESHLAQVGTKPFTDNVGRTSKKFKSSEQIIGQADCCRKIGSVLLTIEAKAYSLSEKYDRGDYGAIRTRTDYLNGWLAQADRLSQNLAAHPIGSNYDLKKLGVSAVLGIVCTPYTEFIPNRTPFYFLAPRVPRVATPREIRDFLASSTQEALIANPNTYKLPRSPLEMNESQTRSPVGSESDHGSPARE